MASEQNAWEVLTAAEREALLKALSEGADVNAARASRLNIIIIINAARASRPNV